MGGTAPDVQSDSQALDSELFKVVADRLVQEAGVEPLLHCLVTEPVVEDGRVRGVLVESKSGRQAILAERVVDATGDADVAFRAGAPCHTHPRGSVMGVTVMFSCSGVDKARFLDHVAASAPTYGDWGKCWSVKTSGKEDAPLQPVPAGAVRPGARRRASSPRTSAASAAPGAASRTRARRPRSTWS